VVGAGLNSGKRIKRHTAAVDLSATFKSFLIGAFIFLSRVSSFFAPYKQLHNARFALPHELAHLLTYHLNHQTSLLLGVGYLSHVLRVRPTPTRRELGNLLVVAPTRGGKGLLAVS
jgi:hypothetical protein